MRVAHRGWGALAVALLLVLTSVAPAAGTGEAPGEVRYTGPLDGLDTTAGPGPADDGPSPDLSAPTASTDPTASVQQVADEDAIRQTQTYALTPDTPGEVGVELTYEIPDRVVSLETAIPANATGVSTDGFDRVNETTFEWDGTTATATIDYRIEPNRTIEQSGPEGAEGRYVAVDAGEWALISRSRTPTRWRYTGTDPVVFRQNVTTAEAGAAGDQLVYLGPVATFERTDNGQTFRLVVPERAQLTASPPAILDSLVNASDALQVGDRDEDVFVVAAPTDGVDWGVRGLETGGSDIWVRDSEPLDTPDNVWLHEYVHSRQAFTTTRETRWLTEGTAVYYAALLTLEQDHIGFATFRDAMDDGQRDFYADVVLADPSTWDRNANYVKGPLVAGRVDEEVRRQTDRESTLQATFRRLNGLNQPVTQETFLSAVERAGGDAARAETADYTETTAPVTMWNQTVHARVFAQLPARIGYALPNATADGGYRVAGPYRTATLTNTTPIRLATGETLTVGTVVRNTGGTEGTYNATLDVNGTSVTGEQGRIGPGNETVVPLSHTFTAAGRYVLSVDGDNVTVVVERPAETRVTGVEVSSSTATQGGSVVVTATVVNDARVPADGTVVFTRDDETVATREVSLPPENTTRVASGVTLPQSGDVFLSANGAPPVAVTVTPVNESNTTVVTETATTSTTGESGPGFTAIGSLVALVVALAAVARRYSERSRASR
ncbi:PGF-CTERM sorting domain-containing protein [Halomicroarcula sp. F13]|uniref:PGF-CTERM sorting domain-containing protein n=1 Tax=Haloarcula rubra TaxID=2487747 RepID=A0AAW4PPG0_9EURY|nr:PGF-CTERM sorting domain-containing protein [Halomicroarcula rubra]MBX0322272.1 PGF-CTERM sorting domain-containing protein [Halomicroarcula rubra]